MMKISLPFSFLKPLPLNKAVATLLLAFAIATAGLLFAPQAQAISGVYAWGEGSHFQLGRGQAVPPSTPAATANVYSPIGVPPLTQIHNERGIERLYSGLQHNIAIMSDGSVFAWGRGDGGQTGHYGTVHSVTGLPTTNVPDIREIPILTDLNQTYGIEVIHTGQNHNIALLRNGEVWVWGRNEHGQLGLGTSDNVMAPIRNDALTHISQNYGIAMFRNGSSYNHILTDTGVVYGWGRADGGRLGLGSWTHLTPAGGGIYFLETPTEITQLTQLHSSHTILQWHDGGHHDIVLLGNARVYGWGVNTGGRLGMCTNGDPVSVPTDIWPLSDINMTPGRRIDRMYVGYENGMFVSGGGTVYTWGVNAWGGLANGGGADVSEPEAVPALTNLFNTYNLTRAQKNQHTANWLFVTDGSELNGPHVWGWGAGAHGRNGIGNENPPGQHPPNLLVPTEIAPLSDLAREGKQFFLGGRFVFAFEPVELILVELRKTLQMPEGTTPPATAAFDFHFTPVGSVDLGGGMTSRPVGDFPALSQNPVTITLSGVYATTANTVTMVSTLNLMDVFGTLVFPGGGVFVWNVHEEEDSSGLTDLPNFEVLYDDSRFQIRVHATSTGIVGAIEVFRLSYDNGNWIVASDDCKVAGLEFLNTYRRLTGIDPCPTTLNGIEIVKNVVGEFADLTTDFTFTLTLTEHFLAPLTFPIQAYRIPVTGAPIPIQITSATTNNITLRHGERFVIPQIWAGTNFSVSEAAAPNFIPSFRMTIGGVQDANETVGVVNTALATGNHIVWDTGRNAADFINRHQHTPPTGLFITTAPWIALAVTAILLLVLLASSRNRKRIEELPLVS